MTKKIRKNLTNKIKQQRIKKRGTKRYKAVQAVQGNGMTYTGDKQHLINFVRA